MTGPVRALIARMLWNGMHPKLIADRTGEPLHEIRAMNAELRRTLRP